MGFTPMQVDQMSLWEFAACLGGFDQRRQTGEGHTEAELAAMGVQGF